MLHGLPKPLRDEDSEPFWAGCDEGRLRLQRCAGCSAYRFPPGPVCPSCGSFESDWVDSPGRGAVYSWVVVHVPFDDALAGQLPYAVGLIELGEGVRMVATIEGCEPDAIAAGMAVTVRFDDAGDGCRLPAFVPSDGAAA
jgi:uncharacterized OB-fold protein